MHQFILPLAALLPLASAQNHLAVLGADGVSVGYHTNSSDLAADSVGFEETQAGVNQPSLGLAAQFQTSVAQSVAPVPTEVVALPSVVVSIPTEQPAASSSVNAPPSQSVVQPLASLESWAAVQSSSPIEGMAMPPSLFKANGISEKSNEWQDHVGQPGPDAAHPMGFWILNRNALKHHISADFSTKDFDRYGPHDYLKFTTATVGPGENLWIPTLPGISPKLYVGVSPNNNTADVGSHRDHDTVIEATFNGGYGHLYYDIDIEKGFSSPVWCHGQGDAWEDGHGCLADLLSVCPEKDQHRHPATGLYDQCLAADDNIDFRRHCCPKSYVLPQDDWNTNTTASKNVLICTIIDTPSTSKIQVAQVAEAQRKEAAGIGATAVLPRRALPRVHYNDKRSSGHA
ncbi:hypothetical protein QM012_000643 [Aureobasidium pullulans]|uniref:Uncharacterized protein n=1 Tax=Aureobasidium pullulans TaxID=5580 RepID=A0ABR0TXL0_AURPU